MKRFVLFATSLMLYSSFVFSQEKKVFEHDPQLRKHHIGINVPIPRRDYHYQLHQMPVELLYRRQVDGKNAAYRIGLSTFQNVSNQTSTYFNGDINSTVLNARLSLGKEWQQQIFPRLHLLFGMDAFYDFRNNQIERELDTNQNNQDLIYRSRSNYNTMGMSPFIGVRYFISNQLYLSYVFQGDAFFRNTSNRNYKLRELDNGSFQEVSERSINRNFGFDFTPSHSVYLNIILK
jgi:hypothetical protein